MESGNDSEFEEAFDEAVGEIVMILSEELREIANQDRVWVKDWAGRRDNARASTTSFLEQSTEDIPAYEKHLRISTEQFNELLNIIEPQITKKDTIMRNAITPKEKLEVTLRYLATGDSFQFLALLFCVSAAAISKFIPEVLLAIINGLQHYLKVPKTVDEWRQVQKSFEMTWNFPNCCGALDGRHIALRRPPDGRAELFKYRGRYSVVLLALVDADSKFLYVEVDTNGRADDMCVFRSSSLKTAIKNNSLNLPPDHVIIADNTFPLTTSIMKPFSKRDFSAVERIFNYRLSRARRVVDNAFGILAARFEVFRKEIELDVSTTDLIVRAACTIHNWLCTVSPETYLGKGWADFEDAETGEIHPGLWRETAVELPPLRTSRAVCPYTKEAAKKRNSIATYFSEEGQVPFQMRAIEM